MTEKIYIQQQDKPSVPVTVRVHWLPCGTIKPLSIWTPDGTCYEVKHVYESIRLSLLKDLKERRDGLRFRIRAEIEGGARQYADYHHITQLEVYLYFADSMFSAKNIIDNRYVHDGKAYIPVTLDVFPSGDYEVVFFEVNGARYCVDCTEKREPRGSFNFGGIGIRHEVMCRKITPNDEHVLSLINSNCERRALTRELNKWFVCIEVKKAS